jgi:hypothetical protein
MGPATHSKRQRKRGPAGDGWLALHEGEISLNLDYDLTD